MDCIFCKIINKEIPTEFLLDSEKLVAFKDIHPKAPVHILVVPKEHVASVKELMDESLGGGLILAAKKIARDRNLEGYKLVFNVGREGGQEIDHLHLHLLGGK